MARLMTKNWSEFQHYKDRSPSWIKLHKHLIDDFEFQCLPVASRALAPMLWLLASEEQDGSIDYNIRKIAFRLRMTEQDFVDAINPLIERGFFTLDTPCYQDASTSLAGCLPREEIEREFTSTDVEVVASKQATPPCPHQKLIDLYEKHLPMLPSPRVWDGARKRNLAARWKWVLTEKKRDGTRYATDAESAVNFFDRYFAYVATSDFLTGRSDKWHGCDLGWLANAENFAKVVSGNYENKEHAE